jgi:hypothetical protein
VCVWCQLCFFSVVPTRCAYFFCSASYKPEGHCYHTLSHHNTHIVIIIALSIPIDHACVYTDRDTFKKEPHSTPPFTLYRFYNVLIHYFYFSIHTLYWCPAHIPLLAQLHCRFQPSTTTVKDCLVVFLV